MKKILLILAIALTTTLSADIARAEIGVGAWIQTPTGDMSASSVSDKTQDTKPYVWALVNHPIPVIPNLRLEYVSVLTADTATQLELTQYDVIPYYNTLDNTGWITLDIGLDVKVIEASNTALAVTTDSFAIPLGYARARFQLPFSGLAAETDVKYISYDTNTVYDVRAKLDYTLDITPLIQPSIEVGYRVQNFETTELLGQAMKLDFAGIYAGIMLRF